MFFVLVWLLIEPGDCLSLCLTVIIPFLALSVNRGPTEKFYDIVLANYSNDIPPWDMAPEYQVLLLFQIPFLVLADLVTLFYKIEGQII